MYKKSQIWIDKKQENCIWILMEMGLRNLCKMSIRSNLEHVTIIWIIASDFFEKDDKN